MWWAAPGLDEEVVDALVVWTTCQQPRWMRPPSWRCGTGKTPPGAGNHGRRGRKAAACGRKAAACAW
jgi:hypothetical protein